MRKELINIDYGKGPEQEVEEYKNFSQISFSSLAEAKEVVFDEFHPKPENYIKFLMEDS